MKTLYLDFENGYKSLGSKDEIAQLFSYPIVQFNSYNDFKSLFGNENWTE